MYKLVNKGKTAEMWLYGDVFENSDVNSKRVAADLRAMGRIDVISVKLNSNGGDIGEGKTIYNLLKQHPARVEVNIDGAACSIASIIACAGDVVRMARNANYMIHDPFAVWVSGFSSDLRKVADRLDTERDILIETYVARTGLSASTISDMMTVETWLRATEAAELGFVDVVTDELQLAASADLSRFRNVPTWAQQRARCEKPNLAARADRVARLIR
jgi:ATP-dependent Clp protease protease subunit